MRFSELASRYAKALYEMAKENQSVDRVFEELRVLSAAFSKDTTIAGFLLNPMVQPDVHEQALAKALEATPVSAQTKSFVLLLAEKRRLGLFQQILAAFEQQCDNANGVCRGTVSSAIALLPEERKKIENIVEKVLKKKVIMSYKIDADVIGGLVAEVGSHTFDDSLETHLRRMNEELKRRTF